MRTQCATDDLQSVTSKTRTTRTTTTIFKLLDGDARRKKGRVINSIINVAQDVNNHPWPFQILDYDGNKHEIFLEPGDILWIEGAK
jgi:hypothetical protein